MSGSATPAGRRTVRPPTPTGTGPASTGPGQPGMLAEAMRRVCRRLEGAFTLVAVDVRDPGAVVGARRNSPLVVARGEKENFLASDVAAFIAYTRSAVELGQDQVAEIRADSVHVTRFDGTPAEVTEYQVDWDISAAEKAGFDLLHAEGDRRAAAGDRRHAARPRRPGRAADPGRDAAARGRAARGRQDHRGGVRHRVPRRDDRQVRHRALVPDPVRGGAGQRVPLPGPDPDPVHPGHSHLPVRGNDGHADGGAARA